MDTWEETAQQWGTMLFDRWSAAEFQQPYELSKLKLQALGDAGYYLEGQRGAAQVGAAVLPSWVVLLALGAVAVAVVKG